MLKNTIVRNMVIGSIVTTLGLGTIAMTFNGESTINDTKAFMNKASQQLQLFKDNEDKLSNAITTLKASKKDLLEQIVELEKSNTDKSTEIASLNNQIVTLNSKIQELEELLANGGNMNEDLTNEINRLNQELNKANGEITKANQLVESLKSDLNNANSTLESSKPMTSTEIDNLISDTTTPPTEEEENPPTPPVDTFDYTIDINEDYYSFEDLTIMIMGSQWVFEGTAQYPVIVFFSDGTSKNVDPNSVEDLSKKVVKVQYKTSNGTTKLIKVNR